MTDRGAGELPPPAADRTDLADLRPDLLAWYDRSGRDLPWRPSPGLRPDPYAVWVSETMLQQTQAVTVAPYYRRWMAALPRLEDLAAASLDRVLELWQGLGYYGRARRLWEAARGLVAGGQGVPDRWELLRALPGVGEYTAAAILSIAFGQARPAVDGNLRRVLSRIGAVEGDLSRGEGARRLRELAERLFADTPFDRPGDLNQALMDLGALCCRPLAPDCAACPVRTHCRALALGRVAEFPAPAARSAPREARGFAYAIQDDAGRWLLGRRRAGGLLAGLWELPWLTLPAADSVPPPAVPADPPRPHGLQSLVAPGGPPIRHVFTHLRLELQLLLGRAVATATEDLVDDAEDAGGEAGAGRGVGRAEGPIGGLDPDFWPDAYEAWRWATRAEVEALPRSRLMAKVWERLE